MQQGLQRLQRVAERNGRLGLDDVSHCLDERPIAEIRQRWPGDIHKIGHRLIGESRDALEFVEREQSRMQPMLRPLVEYVERQRQSRGEHGLFPATDFESAWREIIPGKSNAVRHMSTSGLRTHQLKTHGPHYTTVAWVWDKIHELREALERA